MQNECARYRTTVRLYCLMLYTESVTFRSPDLTQGISQYELPVEAAK